MWIRKLESRVCFLVSLLGFFIDIGIINFLGSSRVVVELGETDYNAGRESMSEIV